MEITQMDYGNICMRHYAPISSDEDWRAWKRCKSRVSASSWLPWSTDPAHMFMMLVNNPTNHGWKKEDGKLLSIWTTLRLAKDVFHLFEKCTCPVTCSRCKCMNTNLKLFCSFPYHSFKHSKWRRHELGNTSNISYILIIFLRSFCSRNWWKI